MKEQKFPASCQSDFPSENNTCIYDDKGISCVSEFYTTGCIKNLSIIIHRSALYIGTGAVAIALIQVRIYHIFFYYFFNYIFSIIEILIINI